MNRKNQILTFTISTVLLVILSGTAFADVTVNIDIDIKPGSEPNSINNNGKGVIPVAILNGTIDVAEINPTSVKLENCSIKTVGKNNKPLYHYEDVNGDGEDDLVVQIVDVEGVFDGLTSATLTGMLNDGVTPITGTDSIRLVPE